MFDKVRHETFAATNADARLLDAADLVELFGEQAVVFKNTLAVFENEFAGIRQHCAACCSFEQRKADLAFGVGDLAADDRRRQPHVFGRTPDRSDAGNGHKNLERFRVEHVHGGHVRRKRFEVNDQEMWRSALSRGRRPAERSHR